MADITQPSEKIMGRNGSFAAGVNPQPLESKPVTYPRILSDITTTIGRAPQ